MSHPPLFHDAPYLTHSDNKIVQIAIVVQTCGTSLIVTNGEYRSMPHPLLFHDAHLLPHFDDKIVQRAIVVQTCSTSLIVPNGNTFQCKIASVVGTKTPAQYGCWVYSCMYISYLAVNGQNSQRSFWQYSVTIWMTAWLAIAFSSGTPAVCHGFV